MKLNQKRINNDKKEKEREEEKWEERK